MGAWGVALSSSDTFLDIYKSFYDLFNEGRSQDEINQKIFEDYRNVIDDEDEENEFYFAIAKAQWECGFLNNQYLKKIKEIIDQEIEIRRWIRLMNP
jgi:hypothetical protein